MFTAKGKREIRVYFFLEGKNEYIDENSRQNNTGI